MKEVGVSAVAALSGMHESAQARKGRGAFFTPDELSSFIVDWAITAPGQAVLEPSCGDGDFLLAAARRLRALGAEDRQISNNVVGYEIHAESVAGARSKLASERLACCIHRDDFLTQPSLQRFDAVVGNPPYVRYQSIPAHQQQSIRAIADKSNVSICALASVWMPFVIQSALHLKPGGRLGFVLPAELLTVNYAAPLRQFLMASFGSVRLVTFDERVFPGVQEEVVLLLAEGWQEGSTSSIAWQPCGGLADLAAERLVEYQPKAAERWSGLFAGEGALEGLQDLLRSGSFTVLEEWGRISLGIVTGRNGYFVLSEAERKRWNLARKDVIPISPPGSKHLRRLAYTAEDHAHQLAQEKGVHLFYPRERLSNAASRYVRHGEALGVHQAYKCRVRNPWWRVPLGSVPDAFVTYMNAYGPSICLNEAGVLTLNSCHGLYFSDDIDGGLRSLFPLACMNSTTLLGAEVNGRAYGGGILKLEPREAARLPVPSPGLVRACASGLRAIQPTAEMLLLQRDFDGVVSLVDAVLSSNVGVDDAELVRVRSAGALMRARRKIRSRKASAPS